MVSQNIRSALESAGQQQILAFEERLSDAQKASLEKQLADMDFGALNSLFTIATTKKADAGEQVVTPPTGGEYLG